MLIDLKRAFETIDRKLLLDKLINIGMEGKEWEWFRSYLTDRKQQTRIGSVVSKATSIDLGLPQGAILSPILFIIYINDIKNCLKYCKIRLFADDALITVGESNMKTAMYKIQHDLDNLYKWLCENKLKLNTNKTKYMIMTNQTITDEETLKIDGEELEKVNEFKYLGCILDNRLNFNNHIDYVARKTAKK